MVVQIVNKNQPNFTSIFDKFPPQSMAAEEAILGGIMLDPEAMGRVTFLSPEHFSLKPHQIIFDACKQLHEKNLPTDLMHVAVWLSDRIDYTTQNKITLLESIGGQLMLAQLAEVTDAINIDQYGYLILKKYALRCGISVGYEIIRLAQEFNPDQEIGDFLKAIEEKIQEVVKQFQQGKFVQESVIKFQQISKELEHIEDTYDNNEAMKLWQLKLLAKKYGFTGISELIKFHTLWLNSRQKQESLSLDELLSEDSNNDEKWTLRGWIPRKTITIEHAPGGSGKTRKAGDLARTLITGGKWGDYFCDSPSKVLFVETDQPKSTTREQLIEQKFEDLPPETRQRFRFLGQWNIEQHGVLRKEIEKLQAIGDPKLPILIIIDSLSSVSVSSIYGENDQAYARPLIRLREISEHYDVAFLILHHSNRNGELRGASAIRDVVDQVWRLENPSKDPRSTERHLVIEKTRCRAPGRYVLQYKPEDWNWEIKGFLCQDDEGGEELHNYSPSEMNLIQFFQNNTGIPFEAKELAELLGRSIDPLRRDLHDLSGIGLISKRRAPNSRYRTNQYFVGKIDSDRSDRSDRPIRVENSGLQILGNRSIGSIDAPELLPEASLDAIGRDRSDRSDRSDGDFFETPTEQELQPKNDKKEMLQITPTDLSVCNNSLQNTPQAIEKPDKNQGAIGDVRSDRSVPEWQKKYNSEQGLQPLVPPQDELIDDVRSVPIEFGRLKVDDILFDKEGKHHQLTKKVRGKWQTHRRNLIDRKDIDQFHLATVQDVALLIKQIIQSKDLIRLKWLLKNYGGSPNSLVAKATSQNPELDKIFLLECN